jgi:hypothetical protein
MSSALKLTSPHDDISKKTNIDFLDYKFVLLFSSKSYKNLNFHHVAFRRHQNTDTSQTWWS